MSGDYTRFTFAARRLFSGVLKQQGRVSLDSDFNEFQEILDRRDRSEMYDMVGPAIVPNTTKDGFKIVVNAGKLTIGVGRMYTDGIQAECFGDMSKPPPPAVPAPTDYDAALGNLRGTNPLPFDAQPFIYSPGFPAISGTGSGINLLYLDVWQREVTSWENELLLEKALAGVDTATRLQTAWQVKALGNVASDACTNPPQAWKDLIAPSSARMTATASKVPLPPGPCVIQPAGGYVGLENRLYRVEVHDAGTLAGPNIATFKWSRDNASLVASVLKIVPSTTGSVISVESTGRDSWLRFERPQKIELLDDFVEFAMRDSGKSGRIAEITDINHATGEISIDQDFSAFPVVDAQHPRIRRWDTEKDADPPVRNVSNGVAIPLEAGISISFGDGTAPHANDTLHAGDHWVFAARTADGSIELIDNEPPRSILHHFAPLAIVTAGNPPTVDDDCRNPWPVPCDCEGGGCECDQCVTQESHDSGALTVQDAVKKVIAASGGTVCIGIGLFELGDQWIEISDAVSVHVRGRGLATVLEYAGSGPAIRISTAIDVSVRDLSLITERNGDKPANAIEVDGAALVTLERLTVIEDPLGLFGFLDQGGGGKPIGGAIGLAGFVLRASIRDCNLAGGGGVVHRGWVSQDDQDYLVTADLEIEHDLILATTYGVLLGIPDTSGLTLLADRTLVERCSVFGCERAAVVLAGEVFAGEALIQRNTAVVSGYGVAMATSRTSAMDNAFVGLPGERRASGILLFRGDTDTLTGVRLSGNRIDGFVSAGVDIDASVTSVAIEGNDINRCGNGIVMREESKGDGVRVAANRLTDIGTPGGDGQRTAFGIALTFTAGGEVLDNTLTRIATEDPNALWRAGIQLVACPSGRIAGNTVTDVGPVDYQGVSAGIAATLGFERLDVLDNAVRPGPDGAKGAWYALLIGESKDLWAGSLIEVGKAIWWVEPNNAFNLVSRDAPTEAAVRGNHFAAGGKTSAVDIQTFGSCTFGDNWCTLQHETGVAVVTLGGSDFVLRSLALATNHVRQPGIDGAAVDAWVDGAMSPKPPGLAASVLGNITDGEILLNGSPLPNPWRPLNVRLT